MSGGGSDGYPFPADTAWSALRCRDAIAERERRPNPDPVCADTAAARRARDHDGIDSTDPFATAKPGARLIKLLIRARRFNAALVAGDPMPFAALAKRERVSPSYFTRLIRLSYLAPDITLAILDGRQPPDLTANK